MVSADTPPPLCDGPRAPHHGPAAAAGGRLGHCSATLTVIRFFVGALCEHASIRMCSVWVGGLVRRVSVSPCLCRRPMAWRVQGEDMTVCSRPHRCSHCPAIETRRAQQAFQAGLLQAFYAFQKGEKKSPQTRIHPQAAEIIFIQMQQHMRCMHFWELLPVINQRASIQN